MQAWGTQAIPTDFAAKHLPQACVQHLNSSRVYVKVTSICDTLPLYLFTCSLKFWYVFESHHSQGQSLLNVEN